MRRTVAIVVSLLVITTSPGPRPAAMVLDVKGRVEVKPAEGKPERVVIGSLLYPGERLVVPVDGAATLAILCVGAQEQIQPGSEATVGPRGCSPPGAVAGAEGAGEGRGCDDEERQASAR